MLFCQLYENATPDSSDIVRSCPFVEQQAQSIDLLLLSLSLSLVSANSNFYIEFQYVSVQFLPPRPPTIFHAFLLLAFLFRNTIQSTLRAADVSLIFPRHGSYSTPNLTGMTAMYVCLFFKNFKKISGSTFRNTFSVIYCSVQPFFSSSNTVCLVYKKSTVFPATDRISHLKTE